MDNKLKILIVGSGPSAYGFLNSINNFKKYEITLIDNSEIIEPNTTECIFKQSFKGGSRLLSSRIYKDILISEDFGGFSNFWGGTYDNPEEKIIESFSKCGIDFKIYLNIVDDLIAKLINNKSLEKQNTKNIYLDTLFPDSFFNNLNDNGFNFKSSEIAINDHLKDEFTRGDICEFCRGFRSMCKENSIWSTSTYFLKLINDNKIIYEKNSKLDKFFEKDDNVFCTIIKDGNPVEIVYDKIILAAGPVGTSEILLKSNLSRNIEIQTSDMIQLPFIKFFRTKKKLHSFSDLFTSIKINDYLTYHQIYLYSDSVLKLSEEKIRFAKLSRFLPKKILSMFGGIFIYLDSNISSKIIMSLENNEIKKEFIDENKTLKKRIFKDFNKKLSKLNIFGLNFLKKEYFNGLTYHFGSQFPLNNITTTNSSNILGKIPEFENVHIVDSSVLPKINTGPGVKTIIANSYRIGQELFD